MCRKLWPCVLNEPVVYECVGLSSYRVDVSVSQSGVSVSQSGVVCTEMG